MLKSGNANKTVLFTLYSHTPEIFEDEHFCFHFHFFSLQSFQWVHHYTNRYNFIPNDISLLAWYMYQSDDATKIKFVKLWDLMRY